MIGGLEMINIDDLRKAEYLDFSLEKDFNDKNKYNLYCYNNITEEKIMIFKGCKIDDIENFSDGYHTFNELYEFRKLYNALLFKEWKKNGKYEVYKSKRHYNGELCFGGDWFIVVAILPTGQISNHYEMKDWDLFDIPEYEKSKYEFDGHTSQDVLKRLEGII